MPHFPLRALLATTVITVLSACAQQRAPANSAPPAAPPQAGPTATDAPAGAPPSAPPPPPPAAAPSVASAAPAGPVPIDADAISALERMGAYLRTLPSFEVSARTTTENIMDDGLKLQFDSVADVKVRRPDRLRVEITSDRKQRQIFYDGKSVTVYGPRVKYYATVPAPPTLGETIEVLTKKYGIELPLADLFFWGVDKTQVADIKMARYIGPATVDGKRADHYAFRQEGVDWQIWIQQGKTALPLKLAITSTEQPAAPTHSAWLRWNVSAHPNDTAFVFKPPKGAMKIVMQTVDGKPVSIK